MLYNSVFESSRKDIAGLFFKRKLEAVERSQRKQSYCRLHKNLMKGLGLCHLKSEINF